MAPRIDNVQDVAEWQLCSGCGVCSYLHPGRVEIVDDPRHGRRPQVRDGGETALGLAACPGLGLERQAASLPAGHNADLLPDWGPVLEVWEGHASDEAIRRGASSGGAATALALYGLEAGGMHGVLHTISDREQPTHNLTQLSRGREDLVAAMGSRYSPASPCEGLQEVEDAPGPCVFIGKPCDVAAARMAADGRPELADKLGLTVSVFCAGTPSSNGTRELLARMGVGAGARLERVTYRGEGWPGEAEVLGQDTSGQVDRRMSYAESWGILQRYRQWRCYVCVDHTGEFADVSVGDPWYRAVQPGEAGRSLVVARSERGRDFVRAAIESGHLQAQPVPQERLPESQPNLAGTQAAVWGRTFTCRVLGIPTPSYRGFRLLRAWFKHLTLGQRAQSLYGTLKRIRAKRLYRRVRPQDPPDSSLPGGAE